MRRYIYVCALALLATYALVSRGDVGKVGATPDDSHAQHFHVALPPKAIEWKPFYEGAELAVLSGDHTKPGSPFVIRIKHRDGLKVPAHWHPFDEHLTVITGTWVMGMGEKYDLTAAQEFPAGSYLVSPKNIPHYALAKGETIVQVHGTGPFAAYFVNPEEDVFRKAK